jgi:hypothetical protein
VGDLANVEGRVRLACELKVIVEGIEALRIWLGRLQCDSQICERFELRWIVAVIGIKRR